MSLEIELHNIKDQRFDHVGELEGKAIKNASRRYEENDVVGGNQYLPYLPEMIRHQDISSIWIASHSMAARIMNLDMNKLTHEEQLIVHRDAGMLFTAATLVPSHDMEPEMDPILATTMVKISSHTGVVERNVDPVYAGDHSRNFTDDTFNLNGVVVPRELFFRLSIDMALGEQEKITASMKTAMEAEVQDPQFIQSMVDASRSFAKMNASMMTANEYVAKDGYFRKLIAFLEGYKVNGVLLEHSGSQLAGMFALDSALGIVNSQDFEKPDSDALVNYGKYFNKNLRYVEYRPNMRSNILDVRHMAQSGNVIDKIKAADPSDVSKDAIDATYSLVSSVHTFRSVHRSSMERTFAERPDSVKYGSAGTMEVTRFLHERTVYKLKEIQAIQAART